MTDYEVLVDGIAQVLFDTAESSYGTRWTWERLMGVLEGEDDERKYGAQSDYEDYRRMAAMLIAAGFVPEP